MEEADLNTSTALVRVGKYVFLVVSLWTLWCVAMVLWPAVFAQAVLRALARVSIVLLPALVFYFNQHNKQSLKDYFLLRENGLYGVFIGAGVVLLYFGLRWWGNYPAVYSAFKLPKGFALWLNFIIGSPLAEELFFRGIVFKELQKMMGVSKAAILSALAFGAIHVPQWMLLDDLYGIELMSVFGSIFIYGVIFAFLVYFTKSLWAALLPHWINNFILLAIA
jgi:membrane protease YdiL (CAAX protease family)